MIRLRRHPSARRHPAIRLLALTLVAVGLGPAVVACADPGPPLADWVKAADEICLRHQSEADLVRPVLFTPPVPELLRKSSELSKAEASELRDLASPSGDDRIRARDYVATLDERNTTLDLLATAIELATADADELTATLAELTQSAAEKAQALGLTQCRAGVDLSAAGSGTGGAGTGAAPVEDGLPVPETGPTTIPNEFSTEDGGEG